MTSEAPELLPCPFCGESAPYIDEDSCKIFGRRTGHTYAVACSNCEVSSPGSETLSEAITAWNTRADLHQHALEDAEARGYARAIEEAARLCADAFAEQMTMEIFEEEDSARNRESATSMAEKLLHAIRALSPTPADPVAEAARVLLTAPKPGRALDAAVTASDGMPVGAVDTIIGTWLRALAQTLRIVVFKEGDVYVAQCLDIDVCTAATTMECLRDRMDALLDLELQIRDEEGQAIDPAPERFHKMWEHAGTPRTQ